MIPEQIQLQIGNLQSFYKANLQFSAWLLRQDFISDSVYPNGWNKSVCRSMQTLNTQSSTSTPFTSAKRSASKNSIAYSWTPRKTLTNIRVQPQYKGKKAFHPFFFQCQIVCRQYKALVMGEISEVFILNLNLDLCQPYGICVCRERSAVINHTVINLQIMTESIGKQDNCKMT